MPIIAVPLSAVCLLAAPAAAAPAAAPAGLPAAAPPSDPVGGPQLASRGIVLNKAPGVPALPKLKFSSYLVADADTGAVLAAKDPHGQYLPASTLKTLTSATLVTKLDPNRLVRPSQKACDVEGTKVGLTPKMQYKVSDLFHALMMMSANDAAVTLAEANGGMKKTIADMNAEAKYLHADDTLAASPNGLDVDYGLNLRTQHTSAYDLVLFLREAMKSPQFRTYVQATQFQFPAPPTKKERKKHKKVGGYPIYTHNKLLPGQKYGYRGMLGGKNGYTVHAQQTYVAEARRDGHTIIVSVMHGESSPFQSAAKLLDWGFAARGKVQPVGTLAAPGNAQAKKHADGESGGVLPGTSLDSSDGSSALVYEIGGGIAGGVLAAGVLLAVYRRRRRHPLPGTAGNQGGGYRTSYEDAPHRDDAAPHDGPSYDDTAR
ncbi:D-alanyl-D-alanine carboxypeptidase family protein [Actinomadura opuntiae]|uniref:D-alanyl-D-alanine carboxypeptidase family protein n=1 Tax=Actinomadura sp. OS1-43 TaxID=604315 RepID=UPI00255A87AB|nr:D-alanyl-D-alanine carboxypeptidase [Actinomadura sp. OS1-43]MDL4814782.1 D-alanyl-D-alanine carboxypeptidase [Actinomadura sp. OS1-43]